MPAQQLSAIAQIEILRDGFILPATGIIEKAEGSAGIERQGKVENRQDINGRSGQDLQKPTGTGNTRSSSM